MSGRFTGTIDLSNGADLEVTAGDVFRFNSEHPEHFFKNYHYIKVGIVKNPERLVVEANQLSTSLMDSAIAFYRGYKFPESLFDWQKRERLQPSIAAVVWSHYHKNQQEKTDG